MTPEKKTFSLNFPVTKEGWKDLMVGEKPNDSFARSIISFLVGFGTPAILGMIDVTKGGPSPELLGFTVTGVSATVVQGVITAHRIGRANALEAAETKRVMLEETARLSEKITQTLFPMVEGTIKSNIEGNPDGVTTQNLYSGNPIRNTDVVGVDVLVRRGEGDTREVSLELREQIKRRFDPSTAKDIYAYDKSRSFPFLYNQGLNGVLSYDDSGMSNLRSDQLTRLKLMDNVLSELSFSAHRTE